MRGNSSSRGTCVATLRGLPGQCVSGAGSGVQPVACRRWIYPVQGTYWHHRGGSLGVFVHAHEADVRRSTVDSQSTWWTP